MRKSELKLEVTAKLMAWGNHCGRVPHHTDRTPNQVWSAIPDETKKEWRDRAFEGFMSLDENG
jgi:hypothetical protein